MKNLINRLKKNRVFILIGILILAIVVVGQKLLNSNKTTTTTSSTTSEITKGNITLSVSASGSVETANYLAVTTSVNGIVKKVFVQEGDTVAKGQKIMEITLNSDGEENLASAYSSYLSAKASLDRAKSDLLTKESALINAKNSFETEKENNSYQTQEERDAYKVAENSYSVSKSDYDRQASVIKQAEVSLNNAWLSYQAQSPTIVAPDRGVIANIVIVEGMDISNSLSERTSSTVASIKKEGTPIASLNINEIDINSIKVGQKAVMTLNSIEGKEFIGKLVGIDKIGTSSNGVSNYPVIVKFDEDSDLVLPNMGVGAEIIIEEKANVILVPTTAIKTKNKKKIVTIVNNGVNAEVEIVTGISNSKYTEVQSGLQVGDVVLVSSLPTEGFTGTNSNTSNSREGMPGAGVFIR